MGKRMFDAGSGCGRRRRHSIRRSSWCTRSATPGERQGGTTFHFVNDGIERALDRPPGDRDGSHAAGGATILEYVNAGRIDEFSIALSPRTVRPRDSPVRARGIGRRGPGAGPRGVDAGGDPPDLRYPGPVTFSISVLPDRRQVPAPLVKRLAIAASHGPASLLLPGASKIGCIVRRTLPTSSTSGIIFPAKACGISSPKTQRSFEQGAERAARHNVARPVGENNDPSERKTDCERPDRASGPGRQ